MRGKLLLMGWKTYQKQHAPDVIETSERLYNWGIIEKMDAVWVEVYGFDADGNQVLAETFERIEGTWYQPSGMEGHGWIDLGFWPLSGDRIEVADAKGDMKWTP